LNIWFFLHSLSAEEAIILTKKEGYDLFYQDGVDDIAMFIADIEAVHSRIYRQCSCPHIYP